MRIVASLLRKACRRQCGNVGFEVPRVSRDRGIEDLRPDQAELPMRAGLVFAHESGIADDIRGEPARKVLVGGQRSLTMAGCLGKERSKSNDQLPIYGTKPAVR